MSGRHRLQHVEYFGAAHLADDYAVGAHAQRIGEQLAWGGVALAPDVGRTGRETEDLGLLQGEFGSVFDGDDALVLGNIVGEAVEQRGLAAACTAADQDIEPGQGGDAHEVGHLLEERAAGDQIFHPVAMATEAADAQPGAIDRKRRYDGVYARAVGQPRVNHRRGLVDPPADARHDAVDDAQQMLVVAKAHRGLVDFAFALDPHPAVAVDQDVGNVIVLEQRLERPQTQHVAGGGLDQPVAIDVRQEQVLFPDQFIDNRV